MPPCHCDDRFGIFSCRMLKNRIRQKVASETIAEAATSVSPSPLAGQETVPKMGVHRPQMGPAKRAMRAEPYEGRSGAGLWIAR